MVLRLDAPNPGRAAAESFVDRALGHLVERRVRDGSVPSSPVFRGGQTAADEALGALSLEGFQLALDEAYPQHRRRSSMLSPWIRHGQLSLVEVWEQAHRVAAAEGVGPADLEAFARKLLWQEYARHRYARPNPPGSPGAGVEGVSAAAQTPVEQLPRSSDDVPQLLDTRMGCLQVTLDELEEDGWLVDQGRRWVASQWAVRDGRPWPAGEAYFFKHLLDASRATNRLAWQLAATGEPNLDHQFSRWEVEARAAGLCASCELVHACPIERPLETGIESTGLGRQLVSEQPVDIGWVAGPKRSQRTGQAEAVWLTAESLGHRDPALVANPELPAVFVFDEPLLARLRLSSKRLVFIVESLSELAQERSVELWLGDPVAVLSDRPLAATFTPVPGWHARAAKLEVLAIEPWPWLRRPTRGSVASFVSWLTSMAVPVGDETETSTGRNASEMR